MKGVELYLLGKSSKAFSFLIFVFSYDPGPQSSFEAEIYSHICITKVIGIHNPERSNIAPCLRQELRIPRYTAAKAHILVKLRVEKWIMARLVARSLVRQG